MSPLLLALLAAPFATATADPAAAPPRAQDAKKDDVRARFEALYEKRDRAGCVALWREDTSRALPAIDQDLEGSLKLFESSKEPDAGKIRALQSRARWGADAAEEALGHPMIADYAACFVGWKDGEKRLFREEQAIYRRAMGSIEKGGGKLAAEVAEETITRALALGDWWGAAMGTEAAALSHQGQGALDDALADWGRARVLYRDLGLADREEAALRAMIDLCYATDRPSRGRTAVEQALATARRRGDRAAQADLLLRRAGFEEKLGDAAAAQASRREAEAFK